MTQAIDPRHLKKLAKEAVSYQAFEKEVLAHLDWYHIPKHWTRKELLEFYGKEKKS